MRHSFQASRAASNRKLAGVLLGGFLPAKVRPRPASSSFFLSSSFFFLLLAAAGLEDGFGLFLDGFAFAVPSSLNSLNITHCTAKSHTQAIQKRLDLGSRVHKGTITLHQIYRHLVFLTRRLQRYRLLIFQQHDSMCMLASMCCISEP